MVTKEAMILPSRENFHEPAKGNIQIKEEFEGSTLGCTSISQTYHEEWNKLFGNDDKLMSSLRGYAMQAVLRSSRFRSICWKVFLEVLNEKTEKWTEETRKGRHKYDQLKNNFVVNPRKIDTRDFSINNPLSQETESPWNQFFMDNELRLTIKQDVIRTYPRIEFYHRDEVRSTMVDILFIYAKLRPQVAYRQGMHELLAPLIFVLHCDHQAFLHACELEAVPDLLKEVLNPEYMEHDAFIMFCKLMERMEPWYVSKETHQNGNNLNAVNMTPFQKNLEQSSTNFIVNKLNRIQGYQLKRFDPELHDHLQQMDIAPQFYGIRWVRLLFGREFPMQDLLLLWDALLADHHHSSLVDYVFITMLIYLRKAMLTSDYPSCLYLLMKFPPVCDVTYFIKKALHLREPRVYPSVPDQFYQKPHNYGINGWENNSRDAIHSKRNLETLSTISTPSSKLSRFMKRPGTLQFGSTSSLFTGLMSKSTSEPMNLITDSALSPVQENHIQQPHSQLKRKGSTASLPPPEFACTPLTHPSFHSSCLSLNRTDSMATQRDSDDTNSISKFFMFGNRNRKMKPQTSMITTLDEMSNSTQDSESFNKKCAIELDTHIGTLQRYLVRQEGIEEEVLLALAGIKQVRDMLRGSLKASFTHDSPDHRFHSFTDSNIHSYNSSVSNSDIMHNRRRKPQLSHSLSNSPYSEKFRMSSSEVEDDTVTFNDVKNKSSNYLFQQPVFRPKDNNELWVELGEMIKHSAIRENAHNGRYNHSQSVTTSNNNCSLINLSTSPSNNDVASKNSSPSSPTFTSKSSQQMHQKRSYQMNQSSQQQNRKSRDNVPKRRHHTMAIPPTNKQQLQQLQRQNQQIAHEQQKVQQQLQRLSPKLQLQKFSLLSQTSTNDKSENVDAKPSENVNSSNPFSNDILDSATETVITNINNTGEETTNDIGNACKKEETNKHNAVSIDDNNNLNDASSPGIINRRESSPMNKFADIFRNFTKF